MKNQQGGERRWQTIQHMANTTMDWSGADPRFWFYCLAFMCFINNVCAHQPANAVSSPGCINMSSVIVPPITKAYGEKPDISALLCFHFNQEFYYISDPNTKHFPLKSKEFKGWWVGVSEHCGHQMT